MININHATGNVIADDSTALFEAADNALLSSARLTVSLLEAAAETRLDPRTKQKILESMNAGHSKLIDSRRSFTSVHSQLVVLQRKSNLAEVGWGCYDRHHYTNRLADGAGRGEVKGPSVILPG